MIKLRLHPKLKRYGKILFIANEIGGIIRVIIFGPMIYHYTNTAATTFFNK